MNNLELPQIKRKNVSVSVSEELEKLIINNVVKPGDRLPSERTLCEKFGVGRYTVREGLAALQARGIIEVLPGKGAFVSDNASNTLKMMLTDLFVKEEKSLEGVLETRRLIESSAAKLAAKRITAEELIKLEKQLFLLKEPKDLNKVDEHFHHLIAKATHNKSLENMVQISIQLAKTEVKKTIFKLSQLLNAIEEGIDAVYSNEFLELNYYYHADIFEAIKERNEQKAYDAMYLHLSEGNLVRYLEKKLQKMQ
jgi:GntR family transcriptional repressor for pyruvate dehydrogenase complex